MHQKLHLAAEVRSAAAQSVRRSGRLPAILYGHGINSQSLSVDRQQFAKVFRAAGYTSLINLAVQANDSEGEHTVLVREVQLHPVRGDLMHADFYQVRLDETITARVPFTFSGESLAVKDLGGILVKNLDDIEVTALPQNLPHDIAVDISGLTEFDTPLRVRDLRLPADVTCRLDPDTVVVLVQKPRSEEELQAELAEKVTEDVAAVEGIEEKKEASEQAPEHGEQPEGKAEAESKHKS